MPRGLGDLRGTVNYKTVRKITKSRRECGKGTPTPHTRYFCNITERGLE